MASNLLQKHGTLFASTSNIKKHPIGGIMRFVVYTVALFTLCNVSLFAWNDNHLKCVATDDGWEEHWGGHATCSECLEEHGECTMRCYENDFTVVVEGRDYYGNFRRVEAADFSSSRARVKAMDRCYDRGLSECRVVDENRNERLVEKYRCQRRR